MTGAHAILLDPLVPLPAVWVAAGLCALMVGLALWRGLPGWWLRGLTAAALLAALLNPSLQTEERRPLSDIVLVLVDDTASNRLSDRAAQTAAALAHVEDRLARLTVTELRVVRLGDGPD